MKDLSPLRKILGMKILRVKAKRLLYLSQSGYIQKILERFGMKEAKLVALLLARHFNLLKTMLP